LLRALWWFLAQLTRLPWKWRRPVPPQCRLTFNGLHDVASYETNNCKLEGCYSLKSRTMTHVN
jgi:hypothetical protein